MSTTSFVQGGVLRNQCGKLHCELTGHKYDSTRRDDLYFSDQNK